MAQCSTSVSFFVSAQCGENECNAGLEKDGVDSSVGEIMLEMQVTVDASINANDAHWMDELIVS